MFFCGLVGKHYRQKRALLLVRLNKVRFGVIVKKFFFFATLNLFIRHSVTGDVPQTHPLLTN